MAFCEEGNERRVESELDSNERGRRQTEREERKRGRTVLLSSSI